jgi:REP element-mobilizing transposase RayT
MSKTRPLKHGRIYHVYNRGVNRETLFKEDRNYDHFLNLVMRHIHTVADIYAYCLLQNHFHLLLRIRTHSEIKRSAPKPLWRVPPARFFGNCFNAYAKAINVAYSRTGCLFERPFKRKIVTSPDYFRQLVVYIHRNPEKHGCSQTFSDWPHSSFDRFLDAGDVLIERSTVVSAFGGLREFRGAHLDPAPLLGNGSFGDFG